MLDGTSPTLSVSSPEVLEASSLAVEFPYPIANFLFGDNFTQSSVPFEDKPFSAESLRSLCPSPASPAHGDLDVPPILIPTLLQVSPPHGLAQVPDS